MIRNIKLLVAYDGAPFLGWQKTKEGPSIEETLERVLRQILQENISLQAASRTDRGVHAEGQVVNFFSKREFELRRLLKGANALLPPSIRLLDAQEMELSFHPTLDAVSKLYTYEITWGDVQFPLERHRAWHIPYPIDISRMRQAAKMLSQKMDFSAFCNQRKNLCYGNKVREIFSLDLQEIKTRHLLFSLHGDHFLYKMARNLVGLLAYVGIGKIELHQIPHSRSEAGVTAPAHGLCLKQIFYPDERNS